jgi:hypothetical protein
MITEHLIARLVHGYVITETEAMTTTGIERGVALVLTRSTEG